MYARVGKRIVEAAISFLGIMFLSPLFLFVVIVLKFNSHGPVFYRQDRIGRFGRTFRILKFRTMVVKADKNGPALTVGDDPRITGLGKVLRRFKVDELPQLWNVLFGEMSLVGPRPEVPDYVAGYSESQKKVLTIRPGLTDPASLKYFDEAQILGQQLNAEQYYHEFILPDKLAMNLKYMQHISLRADVMLIYQTAASLFFKTTANKSEELTIKA